MLPSFPRECSKKVKVFLYNVNSRKEKLIMHLTYRRHYLLNYFILIFLFQHRLMQELHRISSLPFYCLYIIKTKILPSFSVLSHSHNKFQMHEMLRSISDNVFKLFLLSNIFQIILPIRSHDHC